MRFPRDLSGRDLARALRRYGYVVTRETGSHIFGDVAVHLHTERTTLAAELFGT